MPKRSITPQQKQQQRDSEAQRQRRLRGHRIKRGLGELGDLDAVRPPVKQPRTDTSVRQESSATDDATPAAASISRIPSSSSPPLALTVFGSDWEEWSSAKRILFSAEAPPSEKRRALSALQLWQARARKNRPMPPYVESTFVLMDAVLCDEAADTPELRLVHLYGAALSRVVHVMTGSFASGKADTYRKRARQIQFPEEAVEVRQRVAHGALPSVSELRWVCGLTLQFLFRHYWLVQEEHVRELQREATARPSRTTASALDEIAPTRAPAFSVDEIYDLLKELSDADDDAVAVADSVAAATTQQRGDARTPHCIAGWHIE